MTGHNDLEGTLGSWLQGPATTTPPPDALARTIAATRAVRPRSVLTAWIGSHWIGPDETSGIRGDVAALRPALVVVLVVLLILAFAVGALLAGSRLLPHLPTQRVYLDELTPAPDLSAPMGAPTVVPLLDGRVLVICTSCDTNRALLYDPSTGASVSAPMASPDPLVGAAVRLRDGRVFVSGDGAEVFDPSTGQFASIGPMGTTRSFPGLALLPDGRILVVGGVGPDGQTSVSETAELFDPATMSFTPTGSVGVSGGPTGTLSDGRAFVASSPNAEVYDPRSGSFAFAGVLPAGLTAASAIPDGRVVVVGVTGFESGGFVGVWDPTKQTYREVGGSESHPLWSATTLDDGRVLVTGGRGASWAAVLDPATGQMKPVKPPSWSRPSVAKLADGRVLLVGGLDDGAGSTVDIFQ